MIIQQKLISLLFMSRWSWSRIGSRGKRKRRSDCTSSRWWRTIWTCERDCRNRRMEPTGRNGIRCSNIALWATPYQWWNSRKSGGRCITKHTIYFNMNFIIFWNWICRRLLSWRELIAPYFVWRTEWTGANGQLLLLEVPSTEQWTTWIEPCLALLLRPVVT